MEKNRPRSQDALGSSMSSGAAHIHRRPPSRERAKSPNLNSSGSRQGHRSIRSPNSSQERKRVGPDVLRDRRDSIGPHAESPSSSGAGLPGSRFVDKEDPNLTSTWRVSPVQKQASSDSFTFPRSMRTATPPKEVSFVDEEPQRPSTVPTMTVSLPGKEMTFRSFREGMCLTESRHAASKAESRRRASGMSEWKSRRAVKDPTWEPPDPSCTPQSCFSEAVQEATQSLQLLQGKSMQIERPSSAAKPRSPHDQRPASSRGSSRGQRRNGPRSPTRRPTTPAARLPKLEEFLTMGKPEIASNLSRAPPWTVIPEKKETQHPALLYDQEYSDDDDDFYYRDLPGLEQALSALPPTDLFGGTPRPPPSPKMTKLDKKQSERRLSNLNPGSAEPGALGSMWDVNEDSSTDNQDLLAAAEDSHVSLEALGSRVKRVLGMNSFRMKKEDMVKRFITVTSQQKLDVGSGEVSPEQSQSLQDEASFDSQDGVLQEPSLAQLGPVPSQKGTSYGSASSQLKALDDNVLEDEEQEEDESRYASGYSRSRSGRAVRGKHSLTPSLPATHDSMGSAKTGHSRASRVSHKQELTPSSLPKKKGSKARPTVPGIDLGVGLSQDPDSGAAAEGPDSQALYSNRILEEKKEKMNQEMALKREELLGPVLHMLVPEQDRSPQQVEELGKMEDAWRELLVNRLTRAGVWTLRNPPTREFASASAGKLK